MFLEKFDAAHLSYETATEWAKQSPDSAVQATAEISRRTADFIAENPGSIRTLALGWSQVLTQAVDEATFKLAVEQIEALGGEVIIDDDGQFRIELPQD